MANVKFLQGLQANLPASGSNDVIDGALYVTTDSKRLFLGLQDKTLIPIAEGITSVTSIAVLPNASEVPGQFYYVTDGSNVLAWSDGTRWLQTNINTTLKAANNALAVENGGVVTLEVEDTLGNKAVGEFTIAAGTNNVTIGKGANDELTISVDPDTTYELKTTGGASANNADDDIVLQLDSSKANDDSSIAIKNSSSVKVKRDQSTGAISFEVDASGVGSVDSIAFAPGVGSGASATNNGYTLTLRTSDSQTIIAEVDPTIKFGNNGSQEVHFVNGAATLAVPTITEMNSAIDSLKRTLNAMTYMGVAQSASDVTTKTLHNGDVYLADGNFTIGGKTVEPGYLIVVQGDEDSTGVIPAADPSLTFDVIAGDQTDTQYVGSTVTHGIELKDSNNGVVADLEFVAGNAINLSDTTSTVGSASSDNKNVITIAHADVTRTNSTATDAQTARQDFTFSAITGITTNAQGHVTGVTTSSITVHDSTLDIGSWETEVSVSGGVATIGIDSTGADRQSITMKVASSSLQLSADANNPDTVSIDLVWGSF